MSNSLEVEGWSGKKQILIILAHPDDPEFFCGGMVARWCALGHEVRYCILTKGQRGIKGIAESQPRADQIRMQEQAEAARLLGVEDIRFMDYMDGELLPNLSLREKIVRVIREEHPHIIVTSDPRNLFPTENKINHPDHRAAGQAVVDAVFPAAGSAQFQVRAKDGSFQKPHQVEEVWLTLTIQGNLEVELTKFFDLRFKAILCHISQICETPEKLRERLETRLRVSPSTGEQIYVESFYRISFFSK